MHESDDPKRDLLRHAVATLAYRDGKTLRDAPAGAAHCRTNGAAVQSEKAAARSLLGRSLSCHGCGKR